MSEVCDIYFFFIFHEEGMKLVFMFSTMFSLDLHLGIEKWRTICLTLLGNTISLGPGNKKTPLKKHESKHVGQLSYS